MLPIKSNANNNNNITNTIYITLYNGTITLPYTLSGRVISQLLAEKQQMHLFGKPRGRRQETTTTCYYVK